MDIAYTVKRMYNITTYYTEGIKRRVCPDSNHKYLEIPTKGEIFELPLIAGPLFNNLVGDTTIEQIDAIIVDLNTPIIESRFKSAERAFQDLLEHKPNSLVTFETKQGDETILYYASKGLIVDKLFNPVLMATWKVQRQLVTDEEGEVITKFNFIKPILYINPTVILDKKDSVERFIVNKLLPVFLKSKIYDYDVYNGSNNSIVVMKEDRLQNTLCTRNPYSNIQVVIAQIPFNIKAAQTPSLITTDKELLNIACEHIEEMMLP